jgi:signal transduction histidine kinase
MSSTVPNLLGALRYRMITRFEAADIKLRWHVNPTIDASELTSKQALNVQRIVQEALTNILKHAKATTVLIEISTQADWMVVRIEDDGIGLQDADSIRGHGMINMQNRAQECNGDIRWTRLIKGTQVELRIQNRRPDEEAINRV